MTSDPLKGKSFGEAVLNQHTLFVANGGASAAMVAFQTLLEQARPEVRPFLEEWIDDTGPRSQAYQFWRKDAEKVMEELARDARLMLKRNQVTCTDEDAWLLSVIAFMNFAYTLVREPSAKTFIQKALGIGFFQRLFS